MLHAAPLADAETVASFLASYARDAKARVESTGLAPLAPFRAALEEALGLEFEGERGEHFFRSSLVQTLFYGVFSAWVLWSKSNPPSSKARFDWRTSVHYLRVPVLITLFNEVAHPTRLAELGVSEILDWTERVLNRVERAPFFANFRESHAVQYFYEPFLQAFDPELRKELGVWYTPPEIVEYMVARVDTVLREELDEPDGLASKNVYVLDPCCGTGSYLVEVLQKIHKTLAARGPDALIAADLKDAAQNRIFGFEILPAPFVVAHLQLGLLLQSLGAPLDEKGKERVGVYLTNALTGWEPPKEPKKRLLFPELEEERDAAEHVKREVPILVILGNPPYNAFAGVSPKEEGGLVEPYKAGLWKEWGIKKFNLDDLYVRFFRLAERRIAEKPKPGRGVLCYISNFSYLGDPSFLVMRKRFLEEFDRLWFDCMNGDSRETGKLTPDGKPDPSVFSTKHSPAGIRVGTAIALMVRWGKQPVNPRVLFRHFWGVTKRADLLKSLGEKNFDVVYQPAHPEASNRFSFRSQAVSSYYMSWPSVDSLSEMPPTLGILENRKESLISIDRAPLEERMRKYCDPKIDWDELCESGIGLSENFARFDAKKTRKRVIEQEGFNATAVRPLLIRPMDQRWCYYSTVRPLWNEPRPAYAEQLWPGNFAIVTRRKGVASPEGVPFFLTRAIGFQHALHTDAYYVPVWLRERKTTNRKVHESQRRLPDSTSPKAAQPTANLSRAAQAYLHELGVAGPKMDDEGGISVWMHTLAIGYSPAYLSENANGVRQDWPRVPLPSTAKALRASAELGRLVAALLDTEAPVPGVTSGTIRPELKLIASPTRAGGGALKESDLGVTAGWGHAGKGGVTMPGKGKLVDRDCTEAERKAIVEGAPALGLSARQALELLGERTYDVYLNDTAYWANIPARVWDYTIGGYQVIKKWLSYREHDLLGRPLRREEVRYVQEMARRIAAILLLEPALDANYREACDHTFPWPPKG